MFSFRPRKKVSLERFINKPTTTSDVKEETYDVTTYVCDQMTLDVKNSSRDLNGNSSNRINTKIELGKCHVN